MSQTDSHIVLREVAVADAARIAAIYNHYVETSAITFEETQIEAEEIAGRIDDARSKDLPWHVALQGEEIIGYTYAAPWKARTAYRFSVEVTVYLSPEHVHRYRHTALQGPFG